MCRDMMRALSMKDYTAYDIHYAAFRRGQEKKIEQIAKRKARHNMKQDLNKHFTTLA